MDDENKKFPNGWGSDEDDDDYGFIDDADEDDEDSAWGNGSPFKKKESVTDSNENEESDNGQTEASVPAHEVKTSENSAAPVPPVNPPYNQGYVIQKQKSNPLFIIVIIILVLIIGVLCTAIFMVNRNKKTNGFEKSGDSSYDEISETTSKNTENDNTETETSDITTAATTEIITESTTEKSAESLVQTKSSVNIPCGKSDVNINYANIINNMDFPIPNKGFILDLNNDGVNEMIIPDINDMSYIMYYYDGNSIRSYNFGNFMALDNFVIYQVDGEENKKYIYYRDNYSYKSLQGYYSFSSSDELNIFIDYPENNGKYSADWTIDFNKNENYAKGNESVETFYAQPSECHDKLLSAFKNYGFKIVENSKYTEIEGLYCDELIKKLSDKTDNDKIPAAYKGLDFINNAPDDMEFYENAKTGYVATESTGLNLSQKPSADSKKIVEMPKNSEIRILGASQKWYYVSYFSGGVGAFAKDFYGYVSKEYISSTPVKVEKVDVYPCDYLGVINTHGLGVIGFATSYVVDGGEAKEVRHRLGDWHVKAVRYCNSKGVLWYELYDAEDGDYYGWVDAEYIDFGPTSTSEYTDNSYLIATGKVITENDDLNMRESNSADSKIIKTIPKGHYVGIISEYGDWLYVKYYADTNSPIYYGFVGKQFIEITERYGNG